MKNLYESFVSKRDREERGLGDKDKDSRTGHTVYVHGFGITEDLLRGTFANLGKIVNISCEVEKVRLRYYFHVSYIKKTNIFGYCFALTLPDSLMSNKCISA